jgi:hypothetical protein
VVTFMMWQADLEEVLFQIMADRGFGSEHVDIYHLFTRFMAERQPLVLLLCGAPWTGGLAGMMGCPFNACHVGGVEFLCVFCVRGRNSWWCGRIRITSMWHTAVFYGAVTILAC